MKTTARVLAGFLLLSVIGWVWYSVAADYDYSAVSGTYTFRLNGEESTLVLKENHSFQQELIISQTVERAEGSWQRFGEGGIEFSKGFMKVSGQEVRADGKVFGHVKKSFGLFFTIALNPDPGGPVFRKKLFH